MPSHKLIKIVAVSLFLFSGFIMRFFPSAASGKERNQGGKEDSAACLPYLVLVSFYTNQINDFGVDRIKAINESPYDGVAVPLIGAYDERNYSLDDLKKGIEQTKTNSKKHIWPWVFWNRAIGFDPVKGDAHAGHSADKPYFRKIKGMDIYNESGALDDFYQLFKNALTISKELGSPGIVVDMEAYNNYRANRISYLSVRLQMSEKELKTRLKTVGKELVDITDEIYPEATVWFLFTGLISPFRTVGLFDDAEYRSITYVIQGMLERAKYKGSKLGMVSGGELSLGYCYSSIDDIKKIVKERNEKFKQLLTDFPNLRIGGTIAPWDDVKMKQPGYFLRGNCAENNLKTMESFKPLIEHLLKSYQYVWIYAAGGTGYNPYIPNVASKYNHILKDIVNK